MKQIQMGVLIFMFCGMGFSGVPAKHWVRSKSKKRKSLTTAQLYRTGPFLGGQSIAKLPGTVSYPI